MASNAIRAKTTLPWLLLAVHHRSIRTLRRRDAGASSPGSAGTSGSRLRARSCACCGRASFSSRCVSSGRPFFSVQLIVELSGKLIADRPQCIPAAFGCSRHAVARAVVQVGTTIGAKPLAVLAAQSESRHSEKPRFAHGRTEVERRRVCIEFVYIG